jgi:hypothetical protein
VDAFGDSAGDAPVEDSAAAALAAPAAPTQAPAAASGPFVEGDIEAILRDLRAQGYSDFAGVGRQGGAFNIEARKDGSRVQVRVDARTGAVLSVE